MPTKKPLHNHQTDITAEGYTRAIALLKDCSTDQGFLASPTARDNYRRIWARDGVIMGLSALMDGHPDLVDTCRQTLLTLARYQGPHGEIPSNIDPKTDRTSFGDSVGRIDGDLWFVIGCGQYWRVTGDDDFLLLVLPVIERVRFLLGAWEYNGRGLLYVPQTGDWADEYLHHGYVLYDQLLYLRALQEIGDMHHAVNGVVDQPLQARCSRLHRLIRANYWFSDREPPQSDIYHKILYDKGRESAPAREVQHWMSFFAPQGYGYRFDALANVLASLLEVSDETQRSAVDNYIRDITPEELPLLPAFHPVIAPVDEEWADLRMSFSYKFKNQPHQYHNGGLWPMVTAFYVADLAKQGRSETARWYLQGIDAANALEMEGEAWSFPEYVHGTRLTAGGTRHQGWSAAAAVIGHQVLQGTPLLR